MIIVDGKAIAEGVLARLREKPAPRQFLAVVLAGDNPASVSFIEQKKKTAEALGVDFRWYRFAEDITQDELRREVVKIAAHTTCGGVLVQLPLPAGLNRHYVLNAIPRGKDVDVLSERALGAFYARRNPVLPPVAGTVKEITEHQRFDLRDKVVAVVGLGLLIGKPIADYLMGKTRGLYLLGEGSDFSVLARADLVIVGVGKANVITPAMLKEGAGVIDFGYSRNEEDGLPAGGQGKLAGDFDIRTLALNPPLAFYTPTPGGTGPILVAKLFENFYTLTELATKKK